MIDCNIASNFLKEQNRMCIKYRAYPNACRGCPLSCWNNKSPKGDLITCCDILSKEPQKAIEIVQKWSNENPSQTLLTEFLKHYPQTELNFYGCPNIAPCELGLIEMKNMCKNQYISEGEPCKNCWHTPINEESEVKQMLSTIWIIALFIMIVGANDITISMGLLVISWIVFGSQMLSIVIKAATEGDD